MKKNDLYYMRCILRRLRTYRKIVIIPTDPPSLGSEALNDEIDWLDCFIDAHKRQAKRKPKS